MICKEAEYISFRNIENQKIEFENGINIIYGNNAQGKTNALEGIYLCAQGRSHRTVHEKDFVSFDKELGSVRVVYDDGRRENSIKMVFSRDKKRYIEKNSYRVQRLSEIIGEFTCVLFTPEHLSIVKDGPLKRRSFIDSAISQLDSEYLRALQRYQKSLIARNKLLQDARESGILSDTISVWSESLAIESEIISIKRFEYIERLNSLIKVIFSDMTNGVEKPKLIYRAVRSKSEFYEIFTKNLEREISLGSTIEGIHKEDILILLNGKDARSFASQGQQRSLALSLKLSEGEISKEEKGMYPVFLFDDILSELDITRQRYLINGLKNMQVIITTCEENINSNDIVDGIKIDSANLIYAEGGKYRRV